MVLLLATVANCHSLKAYEERVEMFNFDGIGSLAATFTLEVKYGYDWTAG